jgi:hypothetical protein
VSAIDSIRIAARGIDIPKCNSFSLVYLNAEAAQAYDPSL